MKNKIFAVLLAAALLFGMLPAGTVSAAEADLSAPLNSTMLSGNVVAAVNIDLSTDTKTAGSFSSGKDTSDLFLNITGMEEDAGISNIIIDPETGEERRIRSLTFPELTPGEVLPLQQPLMQVKPAPTYVGDVRNIPDNNKSFRSVRCLYIGLYCTVWGATDDVASVCINSSIAKDIANSFDSYYPAIVNSFGSWYDTDGDGKLAIFCYDIDHDAVNGISNSYTAGFFRPQDLIDSTGRIGNFNFGSGNYIGMGLDCIHLDTYPAMGSSNKLGNVSNAYSTLVHETQHLISFSNQITQGKYYGQMETWLNEAFSMAAEHMICGSDSTASRVRYFNNNYTAGTALTYWGGTLSNYANSYLFGQYIRTRYGTQTGTDGSTLFKATLDAWQSAGGGDTLAIIADILDTTPKQLVLDFWAAVYLKEASGSYGFRGESWAQGLTVQTQSISASTATAIYNGGAKFYTIPAAGFTVSSQTNVEFVRFSPDGGLETEGPPEVSGLSALRTAVDKALLTLQSSKAGFLRYMTSQTPITEKSDLTNAAALSYGTNTLNLTVTGGRDEITLYYCTESSDGTTSEIREFSIPVCPPPVFIECSEGGSLQLSFSGISVESGGLVPIGKVVTITVTPDDGYAFSHLTVNGQQVDGFTFTMPDADSVTVAVVFVPVANFVTGGTCGESVWWYLTDENADGTGETLTVYGKGDMTGFYESKTPWIDYRDSLTNAVLSPGVTSIGRYAFYKCSKLRSISLPDTVTSIAKYAFYGCACLLDITIPKGVTSIQEYTYYGCSSLTEIAIPDGVTAIHNDAFFGCSSLTEVTVPDGLTEIGSSAFDGCRSLKSITLPDSVTSIESFAFAGCSSLTEITIPNSITELKGGTFSSTGLKSVVIPDGISTIEYSMFSRCKSLQCVVIPPSITTIRVHAFLDCSALTDVLFLGTKEQWDSIVVDYNNDPLQNATLHLTCASSFVTPEVIQPEGGTIVLSPILARGETFTVGVVPAAWNYSFGHLLVNGMRVEGTSFIVPETGQVTVSAVFESVPDNIDGGFCGNDLKWYLTDENADGIGETLTVFGTGAMNNYTYARDIPWYAYRKGITNVILEPGITVISDYAFEEFVILTGITIPEGVTKLGRNVFYNCSSLQNVVLPQSLKIIDSFAFSLCRSLRSISLPQNLTTLENSAFNYCTALRSIHLPGGIGTVNNYCFNNCTALQSITFSPGIENIGYCAFIGCSSLNEVVLPQGFASIGSNAFYECGSLQSIVIPESVTTVGPYAFFGTDLTDVYYTGTQTQWNSISINEFGNKPLTSATLHLIRASDLLTPEIIRPTGGTLELSGLWIKGETITAAVTPAAENYAFRHLLVNGQPVEGLTFIVPDAETVTVTAVFEKLYDVILTVTQPTGGTLTLSKEKALFGETVTVTAVPAAENYVFSHLLVNGEPVRGLTFIVPDAETVTVTAVFRKLYDITLTVAQPANGTLELSKSQVLFGETVTVSVSANPGYEFAWLLINGVRQDGLTFTVPEAETVTVTALFSKDGLLTHTASENGTFTVTAAQFREEAAVGFVALYSAGGRMLCMVQRDLLRGQDMLFSVTLSKLPEEPASCRMFFAHSGTFVPMDNAVPISLP